MKHLDRYVKLAPALLGSALLLCTTPALAAPICNLGNGIENVVYVEFDNVHFTRDDPNVPSDLEQMPNLTNFIAQNGTLDTGDHPVLISHTANDILTTQTGLYSNDDGIFVSNSFGDFGPAGVPFFPSSFFYWTDLVEDITPATDDATFALTTPQGKNVPAPWVPFTRAGCDVGAYSTANIVLERAPFDVQAVFGAGSPEASETTANQSNDFIGEAIHCAQGSTLCDATGGIADQLPDEPGGYTGYKALFGSKYVNPAIGGLTDINGNTMTGFPGFDPTAAQTLGAVADMLEHNIHVVFAYISDLHDNEEGASLSSESTFGPGEAPYVKQIADYNAAFGKFFARLKADGIDTSNTLFVFTPDEGDHFVGAAPTNPGCDGAKIATSGGVTTVAPDVACTYPAGEVGELDINLGQLVQNAGNSTPFAIHFDDAPTVYVNGNPARANPKVRALEQLMGNLSAPDPETGTTQSLLGSGLGPDLQGAMVDAVGQHMLHMYSVADPARSPTFTFFGNPNFFFETVGSATATVGPGFAWNHGDIQQQIGRTFIAMAGPGVKNLGITRPTDFFTDHVDVRPTILALAGLKDDYGHDGRVIAEALKPSVMPAALRNHLPTAIKLGQILKKIDAPFGTVGQKTLSLSTTALLSSSRNDQTYNRIETELASLNGIRDPLASEIKQVLEDAEFNNRPINELQALGLMARAQLLLLEVAAAH